MVKNDKTGKTLREVIDEKASGSDYTSYVEILSEFYGKDIKDCKFNLNSFPEYGTLKMEVSRAKQEGVFEYKNGKNVSDGFKYKEGFAFYFRKMEEQKQLKKKEGEEKKRFVTAGLQMLFNDETISEPLVEFECINELKNLSLVKMLFHYLGRMVISFKYNRGYKEVIDIIMHPHLLKEYNSRWFIFGYTQEGTEALKIGNFSIDRICSPITKRRDIVFQKAPDNYYKNYFKDIVGVTKKMEDAVPEVITIRTTDYKVHHLVNTKPIHESQKEIKPFVRKEYEDEKGNKKIKIQEGEFTIKVIPNIELQTRILSYGSGLYVIGKGKFQEDLRKSIAKMVRDYLLKG